MGGTERQTVTLAHSCVAAGHEVLLLTFRPQGALDSAVSPKVQRAALQSFDWGIDWFAPGLVGRLRDFQPDIIQCMGRMANCQGWRLIKAFPDAPVVATFRTGRRIPKLYHQTLTRAAAVVFNSTEAAARIAINHRIDGARVAVIRNAVNDPSPSQPGARVNIRSEIGTPPDAIVFIRTAMLRPEKGHADLLRIMAGLELNIPWELWIVGDGPQMESCVAQAGDLQMNGRVRFLGLRNDVAELNAAADIAVLVSNSESLPNCLVEAQWSGLPIVARQTGGVGETFVHNKSGLLTPAESDDAFREALCRLARDSDLRSTMGKAAVVFAKNEFDPETQNGRYLKLYEQLLRRT
jgi:glycosyltransferase involved in cell wall biosynthesis